eukprot:TRINITY_DN3729_c0_g1_i1.p1 TRINITY_DN3729_c0_g1~~TRINITY_DN3729_c0_g1_i1.p1  ORF type:complete len:1346 (+),score=472.30 TRINITY_DN3729_c0_g1_i1:77-4114(+)
MEEDDQSDSPVMNPVKRRRVDGKKDKKEKKKEKKGKDGEMSETKVKKEKKQDKDLDSLKTGKKAKKEKKRRREREAGEESDSKSKSRDKTKKQKKKEKKEKKRKRESGAADSPKKQPAESKEVVPREKEEEAAPRPSGRVSPEPRMPAGEPSRRKRKRKPQSDTEAEDGSMQRDGAWDDWRDKPGEPPKAHQLALTALRCGLPGKFLTTEEQALFREITADFGGGTDSDRKRYLYTRNLALWLWDRHPDRRLYLRYLREVGHTQQLLAPWTVFKAMEEQGWINFGRPMERYRPVQNQRRVVVIGAGASGLVCAQQLRRNGFRVTVLEPREWVGGRCADQNVKGSTVPIGPASTYQLPNMMTESLRADGANALTSVFSPRKKATGLVDITGESSLVVEVHHEGREVQVNVRVNDPTLQDFEGALAEHRRTLRLPDDCNLDFFWSHDHSKISTDAELQQRMASAGPHSFHCRPRPVWQTWDGVSEVPAQTVVRKQGVTVEVLRSNITVKSGENSRYQQYQLMVRTKDGDTMLWDYDPIHPVEKQKMFEMRGDFDSLQEERAQRLNRDPLKRPRSVLYTLLRQAGVRESWFLDLSAPVGEDFKHPVRAECKVQVQHFDTTGRLVDPNDEMLQAKTRRSRHDLEHMTVAGRNLAQVREQVLIRNDMSDYHYGTILQEWEYEAHARAEDMGPGALPSKRSLRWQGTERLPPGMTWQKVFQSVAERLHVRHGRTVVRVERQRTAGRAATARVHYKEQDGSRGAVDCDYVVCTAPIGVLQSGDITFTPPLSDAKREAIRKIGCGYRNLLILSFESAWWRERLVTSAAGGTAPIIDRGELVFEQNIGEMGGSGLGTRCYLEPSPPHIVFALSGDAAMMSEQVGMQAPLARNAMQQFSALFPGMVIPMPVDVRITSWMADPYARCSAPFCGPETEPQHFEELGTVDTDDHETLPVHLAGDHTQWAGHGTLYAAVESGIRAASQIIERHKKAYAARLVPLVKGSVQDILLDLEMAGPSCLPKHKQELGQKRRRQASNAAEQLVSAGSSRNLKAKYAAQGDTVPLMLRDLFGTAGRQEGDADRVFRGGHINYREAFAIAEQQQRLYRLERQSEQHMQSQRRTLRTNQAKATVRGNTFSQAGPVSSNSVDDALPAWCYQGRRDKSEPRDRSFRQFFFDSGAKGILAARQRQYQQKLEGVVETALQRHSDPALSQQAGLPQSIRCQESLQRRCKEITEVILRRLQGVYMTKSSRKELEASDWDAMPDTGSADFMAAVRDSVDKAMVNYSDPLADEVLSRTAARTVSPSTFAPSTFRPMAMTPSLPSRWSQPGDLASSVAGESAAALSAADLSAADPQL